jgi:hypothetical protein
MASASIRVKLFIEWPDLAVDFGRFQHICGDKQYLLHHTAGAAQD